MCPSVSLMDSLVSAIYMWHEASEEHAHMDTRYTLKNYINIEFVLIHIEEFLNIDFQSGDTYY